MPAWVRRSECLDLEKAAASLLNALLCALEQPCSDSLPVELFSNRDPGKFGAMIVVKLQAQKTNHVVLLHGDQRGKRWKFSDEVIDRGSDAEPLRE